MKTETEKAIEFCENVMYQEDVCDCEEDDLLYNKEMRKVITLLQQGEKYKKMWGKLHNKYWKKPNGILAVLDIVNDMEKLEQKHFPKGLPDGKTTKL